MTGRDESAPGRAESMSARVAFRKNLDKVYGWYTGGFIAFVLVLAVLEQVGLSRRWIGIIFLLATIVAVRGHRHHEPDHGRGGVLRGRAPGAGGLQRHGHGRRLDVGGVVHRSGGNPVPDRL
jgi:hypothetical protein